jgi:hypothetical protein
LIRNEGVQNSTGFDLPYRRESFFSREVQYNIDENLPQGQYAKGFKIPHDTIDKQVMNEERTGL